MLASPRAVRLGYECALHDEKTAATPVTYDMRAYSGLSFWAAFGGNNPEPFLVRFAIVTIDTAYNSPNCTVCNDHYTKKLTLTRQWTTATRPAKRAQELRARRRDLDDVLTGQEKDAHDTFFGSQIAVKAFFKPLT